ncbi:ABC transporter substrate-binding protein [Companilactobacillus furfuricola]|uniref:taurine ABC transporter substrate-binding protein n=1 Tax=Companilactobacillus furfuricola TaxID=1462575 RepID=UPI0013DDF689|nr:ABC transporter substrate-binding protein [Companilactobacillus furfuricola]
MSLFLFLTACTSTDNNSDQIKIGILNTPNDVAVARNLNYFEKEFPGKQLKFITFDSGVDANKALMSGGVDFATMGDTNGVVALTADIPVKLLWINEICGNNEQLIVKKSSNIKNIQDLKGKKIATPFASTSHYSLMIVLKKYHLEDKVTVLDMDTQNIVAAWKRGNIDAAYTWQPTLTQLQSDGKTLLDSSTLGNWGYSTGNVTLVRDQFLKDRPKDVEKFVKVLSKAHKLRKSNYHLAVKAAAKQTGISVSDADKQMKGTDWISIDQEYSTNYLGNKRNIGQFVKEMQVAGKFMYGQQTISYAPGFDEFNNFTYRFGGDQFWKH